MRLPIGISDFKKLIEYVNSDKEQYLYVDKTLFIKEILEDGAEVLVFTRPRRFGKTMNLSMLEHFFAAKVEGQSTKGLFDNLKIAQHKNCMEMQGKFPVIFISLKDVKTDTYEDAIDQIYEQIKKIYKQHSYVLDKDKLGDSEKNDFKAILNQTANITHLSFSLEKLSSYLRKIHQEKVYILIDEYDTPIQAAYLNNYYEKFINFIRVFLGSALKGNNNLQQGILSGILRVSKESLFSDLNNVKVCSILGNKYGEFFGFKEEEVEELLIKSASKISITEFRNWYNGYNFAGVTVYNPWSIIEALDKGEMAPYWINTSGNELIKDIVVNFKGNLQEKLQPLLEGKHIQEFIDEHAVFNNLYTNITTIWSLLLSSGYLSYSKKTLEEIYYLCDLRLPNKEVLSFFALMINEWLSGKQGLVWYREFLQALAEGRVEDFSEKLADIVEQTLGLHDVSKRSQESFYHGLTLGFVAGLKDTHIIKSNKESGLGRYDIMLQPKDKSKLGIVIELKASKDEKSLKKDAKAALNQIKKSNYIAELKQNEIQKISSIGIAFYKKQIVVVN